MSRLTALRCGLVELVLAAVAITAISQGISHVPARILLLVVLYQELDAEPVSAEVDLVVFNNAVALLVGPVRQPAISARDPITSHVTARLRQWNAMPAENTGTFHGIVLRQMGAHWTQPVRSAISAMKQVISREIALKRLPMVMLLQMRLM